MATITKPKYVTNEHLVFLDNLRESGKTNMYGAGIYLERKFSLRKEEATKILLYWMDTFSERVKRYDVNKESK